MAFMRNFVLAAVFATPIHAAETYDLIFKMGTLDDVSQTEGLTYDRETIIATNPDYADRNTGNVALAFALDDMATLKFTKGQQYRNLGQFPATVGNPIIMYFVETVLRDVAQEAGGSPFYIRNRIKEALVMTVPIDDTIVPFAGDDVSAKQIVLKPFEEDDNREKMGVYGNLSLTFVMSDEVPGWYVSLTAEALNDEGDSDYLNALRLMPTGDAE